MRRILVINPNTNPAVTQRVRQMTGQHADPDISFEVVNPTQGPFSIESASDRQQAEGHVLDLIRARARVGYDAYVMACFDDLALQEARSLVDVPVVGTCEAGIRATRAVTPCFMILTTVHEAVPGIRALMSLYNAGSLASVRAAGIGVAAAASAQLSSREQLVNTARQAIREDGARAVLLASGGLTGQAPELSSALGVPVIDGVEQALLWAMALVRDDAVEEKQRTW